MKGFEALWIVRSVIFYFEFYEQDDLAKGLKKFKSVFERYSRAFDFFQIVFRTGTIHKNYSMSSFDIGY